MARPRDPRRDEAFHLWKESDRARLLKDIADELGVTSSTVRKWKANDKWEDKFKGSAPLRSGAPKGNKNSFKIGEYETIMFLSIRLLSVRETRMMRLITKYENGLTDKQRTVLQQMRKMKTLYRLQIKMV